MLEAKVSEQSAAEVFQTTLRFQSSFSAIPGTSWYRMDSQHLLTLRVSTRNPGFGLSGAVVSRLGVSLALITWTKWSKSGRSDPVSRAGRIQLGFTMLYFVFVLFLQFFSRLSLTPIYNSAIFFDWICTLFGQNAFAKCRLGLGSTVRMNWTTLGSTRYSANLYARPEAPGASNLLVVFFFLSC